MPNITVRSEIALCVVATGLILTACGGGTGDLSGPCPSKTPATVEIEGDLTTDELVDLVEEALTCPGYAFHVHTAAVYEGETSFYTEKTDTWIYVENNVGRYERVGIGRRTGEDDLVEDEESRFTVIIYEVSRFIDQGRLGLPNEENLNLVGVGPPPSCLGLGREALSGVISCQGRLWEFETMIETDLSFRGRPAIALLATGESNDAGWNPLAAIRWYFDPETLLPLGDVTESTDTNGEADSETSTTYETRFVPLDSLPSDFFDPASIGDLGGFPLAPLDSAEIPVYWLGSMFESGDEYPTLALESAVAFVDRGRTPEFAPVAQIDYRRARGRGNTTWVRLEFYPPALWESREEETQQNPCEETVELDLPGIQATLRRHYQDDTYDPEAPCPPHDKFTAAVHFDGIVVRVEAPEIGGGTGIVRSPYDSEAAIELLVRSLVLRK